MQGADDQLREMVAADHERLRLLEKELERTRESVHSFRDEIAAVRLLANEVATLARDVRDLGKRVETVTLQALRRPGATFFGVTAQYLAILVAIIALIVATRR